MIPSTPRINTLLLSAGHMLNDFYCNFLPILLPIIMPKLGLSLTLSGLLVMVMSITSNLLQPVFGYFMDRHNWHKVLVPVLPFGAACICTIGFVESKALLFLLIALTGLSVSLFHPLGSTLVEKSVAAKNLAGSMSYYIAGGNFGFAFAPIALVAFTETQPLTALPWLILPSLLLAWIFSISKLSTISTRPTKSTAIPKPPKLTALLANRAVIKLNLSMGLRCWTHTSVATFLPLLLIHAGYSSLNSGLLLTLFLVGCTAGGLVGGWTGGRYLSHKRVIIASLLLGTLPTYYFFTHAGTNLLALIALFFSGFFLLAPQPSSIVWAHSLMPGNAGMASGMMVGLSFGLGSIGTALTAWMADFIGLFTALLLTTIPMLLSALVAFITPLKSNGK
ncbi:MAG: MFS transporter [Selenomonas sp.]|uniref:MFS transporter n=1 Tax=Selenomonas sp. TaxID=2053611 RepID=UPI0025EA666B|nr:MFS transporter [Selenomonas sp.]MCR5438873.1 MFS transporter [Selenomonas sp.]